MLLLERDVQLTTLGAYWAEALTGRGRLVFLGGEEGAGKTSLGVEFARRVGGRARVLVGTCDSGPTPRPLGPLSDVAEALGLSTELEDAEVPRTSLFPRVRRTLGRSPTLLLLEDLHWADEATLDLIRYLGRRLTAVTLLVVATFRDDEVTGLHPLATVMGDLATAVSVSRMQLPLLSAQAVAELARLSDRAVDVDALYRSTDGNPFFVTEVLATDTAALPVTVRDAVAARAARLSDPARRVLDAAAVIGTKAEIDLLVDVSGQDAGAVDECVAGGILLDRGTDVAFRHELARQARLDAQPPAARIDLHRRLLARLIATGSTDHRRLALHAVACADSGAVVFHAPLAAQQAARLGSHREAAEHLRTALRLDDRVSDAVRAELLERLSYECYLTAKPMEALEARRRAAELRAAAGEHRRLGVDQRWLSRLSWLLGRNGDAERYAVEAVATLEPLGIGSDLAMAYSNVSRLRMLGSTPEVALDWGRRALDAARAVGDREVESDALTNMGTALLRGGELRSGRALLDQALELALADGMEEHAARAYTNIGALQAAKRMLSDAVQTFRTGIAYCDERDLDSSSSYMRAWLSGVLLEQGRVEGAVDLAEGVLRRPHHSLVSRIPAMLAITLAAVRRGDPAAPKRLAEVDRLARGTAEPQRLLPLALLQAEAAWTDGRRDDIVPLTDEVWTALAGDWEPWVMAELAWWRTLGGAADPTPFELPPPFALMRAGRVREASAAWTSIGRPFWSALALTSGGPEDTSEAVTTLLRLGDTASAIAVRRELARRGLPVPRAPRGPARTNTAGLTARELDILGCLVEGLSNAEIAARLTISERTVGHHVSAVLRKLGVPTRSRAAAMAPQIIGVS